MKELLVFDGRAGGVVGNGSARRFGQESLLPSYAVRQTPFKELLGQSL